MCGRSCPSPWVGCPLCEGPPGVRTRMGRVLCVHTCLCVLLLLAWFHSHGADEEMRPATFHRPHEMLTRQRQPRDPNPSLSQAGGLQLRHTGVT